MLACCCYTVDNSSRVKAAVLLAPVGGDAGALGEVADGRRLHVNDLHTIKNKEVMLTALTQAHYHRTNDGRAEEVCKEINQK